MIRTIISIISFVFTGFTFLLCCCGCVSRFDNTQKMMTHLWKSLNGHDGWLVTYLVNNNSIFLPAADGRHDGDLRYVGSNGGYWSSTLNTGYSYYASLLGFTSDDVYESSGYRCYGFSVRPVSE